MNRKLVVKCIPHDQTIVNEIGMYNSLGLDKLDMLKDHTDPTVIVDSLNLLGHGPVVTLNV